MQHPYNTVRQINSTVCEFEERAPRGPGERRKRVPIAIETQEKTKATSIVGVLVGLTDSGNALVDFQGNETGRPLVARSTVSLAETKIGSEVVLLFDDGDCGNPIILGFIQSEPMLKSEKLIDVRLDGEKLLFSAEREIVLRCGKASITLTRAGKLLIEGAYVSSRSSGVNRIRGGSVQIN
jgi:hypothetical protein